MPVQVSHRPLLLRLALQLGIAMFCAILLLLGLANLPPFTRALGTRLAQMATEVSSLEIGIDRARPGLHGIYLEAVSVERPGYPLLTIERLLLEPDLESLLNNQVLVIKAIHGTGFKLITTDLPLKEQMASARSETQGDGWKKHAASYLAPKGFELELTDGTAIIHLGEEEEARIDIPRTRLTWERPGSFPITLKIILRSGDDDGGLSLTATTLGEGSGASIEFYGPGFPLEPYRALLTHALPRSLQQQLEPFLSRLTHLPILGGNFTLEYDGMARVMGIRGELTANDVELFDPLLASLPAGPIDFTQDVSLAWYLDSQRLTLDEWKGRVNKVPYQIQGSLHPTRSGLEIALDLNVLGVPYQDFLDSIPPSLIPALQDVLLGGAVDAHASIAGNLEIPDDLEVRANIDWSRLRLARRSEPLQGLQPLRDFVYVPYSTLGVRREFKLGRDQSGWTTYEALPIHLVNALLSSEDINFFKHDGFDVEGLKAAFFANLRAGKAVRGGSTITQQLAKNLFLSRERTLIRKFQEAVLAWELEQTFNKEELLELYVNVIEWGPGLYGVGRAADHYFGKLPQDLTMRESAFLCSIIPNPVLYYKFFEEGELTDAWRKSVQVILDRMRLFGFITPDEHWAASQDQIHFRRPGKEVDWLDIADGAATQAIEFK